MDEKVKYWLELSDYDLETAKAMLKSKRYLYVGFMCHQSIEKILKAYYSQHSQDTPPFSHSLSYLSKESGINKILEDHQKEFMDQIEPLNIEARYPSQKDRLFKSLTKERCQYLIENTKKLQKWIKQKL
jgi:HEPN domain-containing protein